MLRGVHVACVHVAYMLRACIEHYIIITNVHCAKIGITCYVCCNIVDDE